jgi:hypothetical protein
VARPGAAACGEKRTATIFAAAGTAYATQPLLISPRETALSQSRSGVWHEPAGANTGRAVPDEGTSEKSPVEELSYSLGPSLRSSATTATARVPASSAAPEPRSGSTSDRIVTDSVVLPACTRWVSPTVGRGRGGRARWWEGGRRGWNEVVVALAPQPASSELSAAATASPDERLNVNYLAWSGM